MDGKKLLLLFLSTVTTKCSPIIESEEYDPKVLENEGFFEGDIAGLPFNPTNAVPSEKYLWPNGVVYYEFAAGQFNEREINIIKDGMKEIMRHTCVKYTPRGANSGGNWVNIFKGDGCYSLVGKAGGRQGLSMGNGCLWKGLSMHELLHATGFWHHHSRSDRDKYLEIHWNNISPQMKSNFQVLGPEGNRLLTDFDYDSIMMYGEKAFSANGKATMTPRRRGVAIKEPYLKSFLSPQDVVAINKLYKCKLNLLEPR